MWDNRINGVFFQHWVDMRRWRKERRTGDRKWQQWQRVGND